MKNKEALIIFVRKPELGKVKTRIAAAAGNEMALAIYQKLLEHTCRITSHLPVDKYVFYTGGIVDDDLWKGYHKEPQVEGTLGERMRASFLVLFTRGYERICIIGSDCFELTPALIEDAFLRLQKKDLVIGPANDGGYYLLGMKGGLVEVFDNIAWSTGDVLQQTLAQAQQANIALLPALSDVDTIEEVPPHWIEALQEQKGNAVRLCD